MRTIGEVSLINAKYYPNKKALVDFPKEFTWAAVNERSNRLANALIEFGVSEEETELP